MTPSSRHSAARRVTVALTRRDVLAILVGEMGWDECDVDAFWRLAKRRHKEGAT
jgi:hypothetical protein